MHLSLYKLIPQIKPRAVIKISKINLSLSLRTKATVLNLAPIHKDPAHKIQNQKARVIEQTASMLQTAIVAVWLFNSF